MIEIVLKNILNIFFVKLIIKSFGLITIVPSIVAILLVIIITNFVTITSSLRYIVMFVLVIFLRTLIRSLLTKYRKDKKLAEVITVKDCVEELELKS